MVTTVAPRLPRRKFTGTALVDQSAPTTPTAGKSNSRSSRRVSSNDQRARTLELCQLDWRGHVGNALAPPTHWSATPYRKPPLWVSSRRWEDVLVDPEEIVRVVLRLYRTKARVVVSVCRLDAALHFVIHHEVDVCPFQIERVNRLPVGAAPRLQRVSLFRIRVDSSNDHRPWCVAGIPRGRVFEHAVDGSVDRIQMHQRQLAWRIGCLRDMRFDRLVR